MKRIVILSGAGISAESGISTFRDSNGLWENHDVMSVASIGGWHANKEMVLNFYNQRRAQLKSVNPNAAHFLCAKLQENFKVAVITQNVDDLHERAGSETILHLHGSLLKAKSENDASIEYDWSEDMAIGDLAEDGGQLRPAIVWFGEEVPLLGPAMDLVKECDYLIIIGTSLQVYPAASLVGYAHNAEKIFLINPVVNESYETQYLKDRLITLQNTATEGMQIIFDLLLQN